ncbi:MAG: NAD-dependent epimerase/dehydratase family protein [Alphaproteobacteria bacterium]
MPQPPLARYFVKPPDWQTTDGIIIITGGLGFIGSCLANYLLAEKQSIIIVDDETPEKKQNITNRQPPYLLSKITTPSIPPIITPDELLNFQPTDNIKAVVHLGALSDTTSQDESLVLKKNTHYSQALWQKTIVWQCPFIYASSAATYGDGAFGFVEPETIDDLKKLQPRNLYGRSKHLFDIFVFGEKPFAHRTPPFFAGLKFFNVFGPNEYHKKGQASVVPQFFSQATATNHMRLFQSTDPTIKHGEQTRDFVWVMDGVWVIIKLLQFYHQYQTDPSQLKKLSGIFNLGSGQATSFNQMAHYIMAHIKQPTKIDYIPMPPLLAPHYQNHTLANINKLHSLIDFTPMSIEQAVNIYINDFLQTTAT